MELNFAKLNSLPSGSQVFGYWDSSPKYHTQVSKSSIPKFEFSRSLAKSVTHFLFFFLHSMTSYSTSDNPINNYERPTLTSLLPIFQTFPHLNGYHFEFFPNSIKASLKHPKTTTSLKSFFSRKGSSNNKGHLVGIKEMH